jgi:eukaryotic-like serine/threonine-protein kinase
MSAYEQGTIIAGKLRVVRLLGAGGMGAVYEVEHTITKHRRALKMLHGDLAHVAPVVTRFLREASAAGHIGNPHIVETFDAGTLDTGEPYIVMELLAGTPLADLLAERGKLSVPETVEIICQACEGVQAAHDKGIVHRDLKPDNLFVTDADPPFLKIVDFGISKFDPELTGANALTMEGTAMGTPFYMPPEQVRGEKDITYAADVYSMGVVLYECLTGEKPFYAETLPHLSLLIHEGKYRPVPELRPDVPRSLAAIVERAMQVDKSQRFGSLREMAEALRALDEPPSSMELGVTMPVGTPATPGGAREPAAATPRGVPLTTDAAAAVTREHVPSDAGQAPKRSRSVLLVAGALAIAAAIGVTVFATTRTPEPAAGTDLEPEPAAAPAAAAEAIASAAPAMEPEPPVPAAASATAAPKTAAAPPSAAADEPKAAVPAPAPKPAGNTRAGQVGLAEENPF